MKVNFINKISITTILIIVLSCNLYRVIELRVGSNLHYEQISSTIQNFDCATMGGSISGSTTELDNGVSSNGITSAPIGSNLIKII